MTDVIGRATPVVDLSALRAPHVPAVPTRDRARVRTVVLLGAGVVGVASLLGLLTPRLLPFVVLVAVVDHWLVARAGLLSVPSAGGLLHGVTLPPALAALSSAGGLLTSDQVEDVLVLSAVGAALTLVTALVNRSSRRKIRVVLVGAPADVMDLGTRWAGSRQLHVVGGLAVSGGTPLIPRPRTAEGEPQASEQEEQVHESILQMRPDVVVVIPGDPWDPEVVRRLTWQLEDTGIELVVTSRLEGIATHRLEHERVAGIDVVKVRPSRPSWWARASKSMFDRLMGTVLLILVAPLLLVLVAAIRRTSPWAGVFTQVRIGQHGRPFTIFKLRTMTTTAEEDKKALRGQDDGNGILFKKRDDPRVTRLGKVLRKYSLDELPQLVNVARGEMSLIGPRPALPEEVERYTDLERRRLAVRPGMTGAWQVNGRSTLSREDSVRLDVEYVDNYRLADDAVIALKTVDAVVRPKGAW